MTLTTVIDVGNFSTKYAYEWKNEVKMGSFSSVIHPYKPLEETEGMTRYVYNNLDYYVGEAVKNFYSGKEERMYFGNTKKGHHEAQIRLVSALHNIYKETGEREFNLILTSPYKSMASDKEYFVKNFQGKRTSWVDENPFDFEVNRIICAAEGFGASHFTKEKNFVIIDAGSMTTNVLYLINGAISKEDSATLNGGTINNSPFQIANNVLKSCPQIEYDYPIITTGGRSLDIQKSLEQLGYENVTIAELDGYPTYYINAVGLLLKYSKTFEAMFT
ncbi:actin like protein [Geobacillus phage GR1]|nr:actin like protein [Geobacillus phage GR1]